MRTAVLKHALALAKFAGPVAAIVAASTEVGMIIPSILAANLEKAGYVLEWKDGKVGQWLQIKALAAEDDPGSDEEMVWTPYLVVANGYSHDKADALLQAVYGWLKEEAAGTGVAHRYKADAE